MDKKKLKPFLKLIKEKKESHKETQARVPGFIQQRDHLSDSREELVDKLCKTDAELHQVLHLIKMYKVMGEHEEFDIWELEKACGVTDKPYLDWRNDFRK